MSLNGFKVSHKTIVYVAGVWLMLALGSRSLIPSICGLCAGLAVKRLPLPSFPKPLVDFFTQNIDPFLKTTPVPPRQAAQARAPVIPPTAPVTRTEVREEDVAMLVAMGFGRGQVEEALRASGNDVNQAANVLASNL